MLKSFRAIIALLGASERRTYLRICAASILSGVIEAVGVASVLPFVAIAANPDGLDPDGRLARWLAYVGLTETHSILLVTGVASFVLLCLGVFSRAGMIWVRNRYARLLSVRLATRLLSGYLARPYAWFLGRRSAELNSRIITETEQVVRGAAMAGLQFASSLGVAISLGVVLTLADPALALIMIATIGGIYLLAFLFVRARLSRLGARRAAMTGVRQRWSQDALTGIKQVKSLGAEAWIVGRFNEAADRVARARAEADFIQLMPRQVLEVAILGTLIGLIVWIGSSGAAVARETMPVLGLYAAASIRLMPVLQGFYGAATTMRFSQHALEVLITDLADAPQPAPKALPMRLRERIELRDVSHVHEGTAAPSLRGVSLTIPQGQVVGISGRSGAGKTTLVDVLVGLVPPTSGMVLIDGAVLMDPQGQGWTRAVGYVPQDVLLLGDTMAEAVTFGVEEADLSRVRTALAQAAIPEFAAAPERPLRDRGEGLSGGQRQRVGLARALFRAPEILVLDEPTSALDAGARRRVLDLLGPDRPVPTVLVISHDETVLEACERLVIMDAGRIAADGPPDILLAQEPLKTFIEEPEGANINPM